MVNTSKLWINIYITNMKVITNEWCCYKIFICDMEVKTPYNQYVLIRISNSSYYSVSKLSLIDIYNLLNTLDVFVLWRSTFLTLFIMLVLCLTKAIIIAKYYYKIIISVYDYRFFSKTRAKINIFELYITTYFIFLCKHKNIFHKSGFDLNWADDRSNDFASHEHYTVFNHI